MEAIATVVESNSIGSGRAVKEGIEEAVSSPCVKNAIEDGASKITRDENGNQLVQTPINSGVKHPIETSTPNSIYEQINPDGTVHSRAYYDENGSQFSMQDFDKAHFDKSSQVSLLPHEHNISFNEDGLFTGDTVIKLPDGYNHQPTI